MKYCIRPTQGMMLAVLLPRLVCAQEPTLGTPGSATWWSEATESGTRTVFNIYGDTVFEWPGVQLGAGSEWIFSFENGGSVLNLLGGTGVNRIDGRVEANGSIAFFSPQADLVVTGEIVADEVTLSTHEVNPADFLDGNGYASATVSSGRLLKIDGLVEATARDLLVSGSRINLGSQSELRAARTIRVSAASELDVSSSGQASFRLESAGFLTNRGLIEARRVEVSSANEIFNHGEIGELGGEVYLEVGEGGVISQDTHGVILGEVISNALIEANPRLDVREGDAAPAVSDAMLKIPELTRPDGKRVSREQVVSHHGPMSASSDASRDRSRGRQIAKREAERNGRSGSLLQRHGMFGLRGSRGAEPASR